MSANVVDKKSSSRWICALDALFAALLGVLLVRIATNARIGADAGYYLPVAERFYDGLFPVRDLPMQYTPLGIFGFTVAKWLSGGSHSYTMFVGAMLTVQVAASMIVYALLGHVTERRDLRALGALTTLAQLLYYDGSSIVLEPFVLLFALSAVHFALRARESARSAAWWWVASGLFGCAAFWAKQYGALIFVPLAYAAVIAPTWRERARNLVWLGLGAVLLHAAAIAFFAAHGVGFAGLLRAFLGSAKGYSVNSLSGAIKAVAWSYVLKTSPYLLLVPWVVWRDREARRDPVLHVALLAMAVFCLPLYVRQYGHYLMLVVPFGVMVFVRLIDGALRETSAERSKRIALLPMALAAFALMMPVHTARMIRWMSADLRSAQISESAQLSRVIPPRSRVFYIGDTAPVFVNSYLPAGLRFVGYAWAGFYTRREFVEHIISEANYVVLDHRSVSGPIAINRQENMPVAELSQLGFCRAPDAARHYEVWIRNARSGDPCPAR